MTVRVIIGDCRTELGRLQAGSVHCVVTSPPYYGLRDYCVDGQIGLEASPEAYVGELVTVFRDVRRVLRPDGCCWLNLGDSFAGSWGAQSRVRPGTRAPSVSAISSRQVEAAPKRKHTGSVRHLSGVKPKDLLGIPWMVAFALRADGWWLRSDVIWHKPNPMPESVTDRPTSAHEHVFLLTPSPHYHYDAEAIRDGSHCSPRQGTPTGKARHVPPYHAQYASSDQSGLDRFGRGTGRNRTNVWTIAPGASAVPHHAMMPPRLAELCIQAGTSEAGCCRLCGAPLARLVAKGEPDVDAQRAAGGDRHGGYDGHSSKDHASAGSQDSSDVKRRILAGMRHRRTAGWRPTCACPDALHAAVPCTVLDPFGGAGTTGLVAERLGRDATLIELSAAHAATARRRLQDDAPLLDKLTGKTE